MLAPDGTSMLLLGPTATMRVPRITIVMSARFVPRAGSITVAWMITSTLSRAAVADSDGAPVARDDLQMTPLIHRQNAMAATLRMTLGRFFRILLQTRPQFQSQMCLFLGIDELGRNSYSIADAQSRTFDDRVYLKFAGGLAQWFPGALVKHSGGT